MATALRVGISNTVLGVLVELGVPFDRPVAKTGFFINWADHPVFWEVNSDAMLTIV